jgi:hypothetical protein
VHGDFQSNGVEGFAQIERHASQEARSKSIKCKPGKCKRKYFLQKVPFAGLADQFGVGSRVHCSAAGRLPSGRDRHGSGQSPSYIARSFEKRSLGGTRHVAEMSAPRQVCKGMVLEALSYAAATANPT